MSKLGGWEHTKQVGKYKESRKKLKHGVRRAKRGHEKALASRIKENPKAFYSYIKSKRAARERVGPLKDRGGNLCMWSQRKWASY